MRNEKTYPHYFKDVSTLNRIDIYGVCNLYEVEDTSGALHHAIKKLLCSGNRGYKDKLKVITEARNTLNRWLEINGDADDAGEKVDKPCIAYKGRHPVSINQISFSIPSYSPMDIEFGCGVTWCFDTKEERDAVYKYLLDRFVEEIKI